MAWTWIISDAPAAKAPAWLRFLQFVKAIFLGLLITLLVDCFLLEAGIGHPLAGWAASGILIMGGLMAARKAGRAALPSPGTFRLQTILFAAWMTASTLVPTSGEWLMGGWDPGVYINQGIQVARDHSFHPDPCPGYRELTGEESPYFTRGKKGYTECFPGVPYNPETKSLEHYFFRLMPTFVASLTQAGGIVIALRPSMVLGFLTALIALGAFYRITNSSLQATLALLLLCSHPLWLYQLHLPTTEMLQLFLLMGLALILPDRSRTPGGILTFSLILFAAGINRISFPPFGCFLLVIMACLDFSRTPRRQVLQERIMHTLALVAAMIFNLTATSVTLLRLQHAITQLLLFSVAMLVACWFIELMALKPSTQRNVAYWVAQYRIPALRIAAALLVTGALIFSLWGDLLGLGKAHFFLHGSLPFLNPPLVLTALAGGLLLMWRGGDQSGAWLVFLLAVSSIVMLQSFMTQIFPWATRRHLTYTVPLLALCTSYLLIHFLKSDHRRLALPARVTGLLLLITLVAGNLLRIAPFLSGVEDSRLHERLQEVASRVSPGDILVADHPWWATPMSMTFNLNTLNARGFYSSKDPEYMKQGMKALERLHREGWTIRFFTSTKSGLDVFPLELSSAQPDWEGEVFSRKELVHSKRADKFAYGEREHQFRLFTWKPGSQPTAE